MKIFKICDTNTGCVSKLEVYYDTQTTDLQHNTSMNVADILCKPMKNKGYMLNMDR
jgi:hypothetical protein